MVEGDLCQLTEGTVKSDVKCGTPLDRAWNELVNVAVPPPASETWTEYAPAGRAFDAKLAVIWVKESTETEAAGKEVPFVPMSCTAAEGRKPQP
jgi:hypothetical protein